MRVTVSLIKADVGSYPGHVRVPKEIISSCNDYLTDNGTKKGLLIDFMVFNCGDDVELLMTHEKGVDSKEIHELAWNCFLEAAEIAKERGFYGAGQDLLKDAFSGNIRGMGPGIAEMSFEERKSEPLLVFACDKTSPSAFNLPMYRIFGDPFNTPGLVIDPKLNQGFRFEVMDIKENKKVILDLPEETYQLLALIGNYSRYSVKRVYRKDGEIAAVISTEKLSLIAGEYVGKDDPVAIVRAQSGFPAVGEVLEAFTIPHIVPGWMRGSHWGPLLPVSLKDARPTRFDGPPRIVGLGFQLRKGELYGPEDLFSDIAFQEIRRKAMEISDYLRRHGPFEPQRLPEEEMEYTNLPKVLEKLREKFEEL